MTSPSPILNTTAAAAPLEDELEQLLGAIDPELPVLCLDPDLRIRRCTPRAAELFHIEPGDTGRKIGLFCADIRPRNITDDSIRALTTGTAVEREVDAGTGERYLMRICPVRHAGEITGIVVTFRDITRRKRAEAEAARAISQRDQYLAVLAGDLRSPLMAILTAAEMLAAPDCHLQRARRAGDVIARQTGQLSAVLDDLLDLSRRRDPEAEVERQRIDLREVVSISVAAADSLARAGRVTLELRTPDVPVWIDGDAAQLGEALSHLLDNAIRFTQEGKRVTVSTHRQDSVATIIVTDEGTGIEPAALAQMFEPYKIDASGRGHGSIRPGLAHVRAVARAHGGEAGVESAGAGRGAVFTLVIPLSAAA